MRTVTFVLAICAIGLFAACGQGKHGGNAAASASPNAEKGGNASWGGQGGQGGNESWGGNRRQNAVPVQVVTARTGQLTADRVATGMVSAVTQSQVASQIAGTVAKVYKLTGAWVKKGETVVQLDDSQLRLALANAQAQWESAKINLAVGQDNAAQADPKLNLQVLSAKSALDVAKRNYEAQKALFDLGGTSQASLDSSLSALQSAQANLTAAQTAFDQNKNAGTQNLAQLKLAVDQAHNQVVQAQLNLGYAGVAAPFAGQIASMPVAAGMYVGLNTTVFTLVSGDKQVAFNVDPNDTAALKVGMPLAFKYAGKNYPVVLNALPSAPQSGMVPLTAALRQGGDIPFGAIGTLSYTVKVGTGVIVPIGALQSLENRIFVYGVADGKIQVHRVAIIAETGDKAVVSGIDDGTVLIVNAPPGLTDGTTVKPIGADQSDRAANPGDKGGDAAPGQGKWGQTGAKASGRPTGTADGAAESGATGAGQGSGGQAKPGRSPDPEARKRMPQSKQEQAAAAGGGQS